MLLVGSVLAEVMVLGLARLQLQSRAEEADQTCSVHHTGLTLGRDPCATDVQAMAQSNGGAAVWQLQTRE